MAENSKIEWTDATWNPVLGCDKISPGCKGCYAIRTAWRLQHNPNPKVAAAFEGLTVIEGGKPNWTGRVNFVGERLLEPLKWKKPRRIFVNSQSDLFHDEVTNEQIAAVFGIMAATPQHTYQILTKRPGRARDWFELINGTAGKLTVDKCQLAAMDQRIGYIGIKLEHKIWPLPNVWLGVSCENQPTADARIPLLLQTPAAVRWISAEPLLERIMLDNGETSWLSCSRRDDYAESERGEECCCESFHDGGKHFRGIDWVVVGGESGPGARPMHPDWARSLRDQCEAAGVPFFFKQWGEWANGSDYYKEELCIYRDGRSCAFTQEAILAEEKRSGIEHRLSGGTVMAKLGKKEAGRKLDGQEYNEYPAETTHAD